MCIRDRNYESETDDDFGYIRITASPRPQEIDKLQTAIEGIIKDVADGKISQSLFKRAIDPTCLLYTSRCV